MEKCFWFYIDTYVHIAIKSNTLLLYNPYTGKSIEFTGEPGLLQLMKQMKSPRNLWVVRLKERDLDAPEIRRFVDLVRRNFMGDFIESSFSRGKPIQMVPVVKVQQDARFLKEGKMRSVGEDVMTHLSEVTLIVNDECNQDCNICNEAFRQFSCCTSDMNSKNHELSIDHIKKIFNEIHNRDVNIRIIGGNIFKYKALEKLGQILNIVQSSKNYYIHYLNLALDTDRIGELDVGNSTINIIVTPHFDLTAFNAVYNAIGLFKSRNRFDFIVKSNEDFECFAKLIEDFKIKSYKFIPFFDGKNLDFFKENVFIDRNDIEENKPTLKEIYTNGAINSNFFGCLTFKPDGSVYSNVRDSAIGNIGINSLYEIMTRELNRGKNWLKIRKKILPCKQCVYEMLRPPISNYHMAIGKYNLCHIRN